jgi:hypothetical protein
LRNFGRLWPRRVVGDAIWLVEFYAPWCSACGNFVETYKTVATSLENDQIEVFFFLEIEVFFLWRLVRPSPLF